MLKDFFKLNSDFKVVKTEDELIELLQYADSIKNILYEPETFEPKRPQNRLSHKTFTNVSFSKTNFERIEFKKCKFVDCLFIGTRFVSCEFHDCQFDGCNPYKVSFEHTYIDPKVFENKLNPKKHSNIGVRLFQQLLENSVKCQQPEYAQTARYLFNKWLRYQHAYEFLDKHIGFWEYSRKWIPSFLYDVLAGYGIRLFPFFRLTVILLFLITIANYLFWPHFGMSKAMPVDQLGSWVMSFYYSIVTMTTLGYGDITPSTTAGMFAASLEALLGLMWLSLLASIVVKRVLK